MTQTETIHTAYGDVEVETVECSSCGEKIAKDDAKDFTIGSRSGYACSYCEKNGPISFPERVKQSVLSTLDNRVGYMVFILLWPLVGFMWILDSPENETWGQGVAEASFAGLVWLVAVSLILLVV